MKEQTSPLVDPAQAAYTAPKPISFQLVLSLVKEAIILIDRDSKVLYINKKAGDIFHKLYDFHCYEGGHIFELLPARWQAPMKKILLQCWSGEAVTYDVEVIRNGQSAWINCQYAPLYEEETIRCISVIVEDITQNKELQKEEQKRKEAEKKLDESRLLFELFMEHAPLRAWITDSNGHVHYMNQQYRHTFGFDDAQKGKSIFELFPRPWAEEYYLEIQKVLEQNAPSEKISEGLKEHGETGLFRITRFPLPVLGEIMVAGWAVEITEQVRLQKRLMREAKNKRRQIIRSIIETQEKERRELSVELHDNVNQILSSCQLMLEVARDNAEAAPHLTEKTYHSLKTAIAEIRKISHELNPSAIEDLGLADAVSELVENINGAGKLKISFIYKDYGNNAAIGMTDKIAVYRIVQEQLNNILKHAHAQHVHIMLYHKLSKLYLNMEDDGMGFDMKQVKKGLGLRNIQHRVEYYQGKLKIDTSPGKGCKLKVLLAMPMNNE